LPAALHLAGDGQSEQIFIPISYKKERGSHKDLP